MDAGFREKLVAALAVDKPYDEHRRLQGGRPAGVLMLLGSPRDRPHEISLLITRRTDSVGSHKGQMAFPGGMSEPEESARGPAGMVTTALRETHEEIGIPVEAVDAVGALPELTTITGYRVTPVVGLLREPIDALPLKPNPHEIAQALWVGLGTLMESGIYRIEYVRVGAVNYPIHVYQVGEHRIWGATGSMIKNLLDRLQTLG